ncbi:NCS2 family permease [Nocardiopsis flavescens]|uniref:Putative MFS transporter, AGZA family, xanthine/uracil permease n=1 Tax=Nocardiopsis flavescens TaxID=758803 RepID=A0A1M6GG94_9ACTN|nr:NCS2 family permease [Nocardiopsis flavescens]SHJ08984.1 putative MFS transporter, AGZA family, xanthine/uracil permease [Nocardiopsis flavescens]
MNVPTTSPATQGSGGPLDRFFHISERGSTLGTEIRGGLATFFAMAYIIVLNPLILSSAQDVNGDTLEVPQLVAVTALVAAISSILMGVVSRYPFALAAGMGLNAVVAFTIAPMMTWADVFLLLIVEGVILTILVLTGFRTAVFAAIPGGLKIAIGVGVGLFLTMIGFVNAGFIGGEGGTIVSLGDNGLNTLPILIFVVGLLVTVALYVRKIRGAMLLGIVVATALAIAVQAVWGDRGEEGLGWQLPMYTPELPTSLGDIVALPDFSLIGLFADGGFDIFSRWADVGLATVVMLLFTLMLADFFDTMGTMVGVAHQAGLTDENGNLPKTREVLAIDSFGTIFGGLTSSSIATVYAESAAGVAEGARTGIAPIVTGLMMVVATFFAPLVTIVPFEAATPVLIIVGFMMMVPVGKIDFADPAVGLASFFAIVIMPFTYSIANGIGMAFIVFTFVRLVEGKGRQVHPLMWVISLVFLVHFAEHPIYMLIG